MARTSTALKVLSNTLYTVAIISGFTAVYPIYTVFQPFQHTTDAGSPLASFMAAVLLLSIAVLAYLAQARIDRHLSTAVKS